MGSKHVDQNERVEGTVQRVILDGQPQESSRLNLIRAVEVGERDVATGRVRPMREALKELQREFKIPD
jgi:hypothetical protein